MTNEKVVVITGASGYIGTCLTHKLDSNRLTSSIIGFDTKPFLSPTPKLSMNQHQLSPEFSDLLRKNKADTLIHLGFTIQHGRNQSDATANNINCLEKALATCKEASIKHIIYLSSTTVYGPHLDNPALLSEKDKLRPIKGFQYAWDKVAAEKMLNSFGTANPDILITIVRSPIVMGPSANNFITKAFFKPVLVGIKGQNPFMQFIHEEDLTSILSWFVHNPKIGIFNVAAPGLIKYSQVMHMSGKRFYWLPASLIYPLTELSWLLHLQNDSTSAGLAFIRYPWIADTKTFLNASNYSFKYSSQEALKSFFETRS